VGPGRHQICVTWRPPRAEGPRRCREAKLCVLRAGGITLHVLRAGGLTFRVGRRVGRRRFPTFRIGGGRLATLRPGRRRLAGRLGVRLAARIRHAGRLLGARWFALGLPFRLATAAGTRGALRAGRTLRLRVDGPGLPVSRRGRLHGGNGPSPGRSMNRNGSFPTAAGAACWRWVPDA